MERLNYFILSFKSFVKIMKCNKKKEKYSNICSKEFEK